MTKPQGLTLNAAETWGVDDQLGSLDTGKTANVVVANGDPSGREDRCEQRVFIAGDRKFPWPTARRVAGPVLETAISHARPPLRPCKTALTCVDRAKVQHLG